QTTLAAKLGIGEPTLLDIISALEQPERDPRDNFPKPILKQHITTLDDLQPGMKMQGTVRNVVDFGVLVDVGVEQDGLVHISKMENIFVKHPMVIVAVGEVVNVCDEYDDDE